MAQVVPEAANRAPRNLGLVQFGKRAELDGGFGDFEKAHPNGVVRHVLVSEHVVQPTAAREIILDLRDVVSDVLIADGGFGTGHA
jgi:hypothetical protein